MSKPDNKHLKHFFSIYSNFLAKDLYVSMLSIKNNLTEDCNANGRNLFVMSLLLNLFKLVYEQVAPDEKIEQSLKDMKIYIDKKFRKTNSHSKLDQCIITKKYEISNDISNLFDKKDLLDDFFYTISIYKKYNNDKQLGQSIIEISNAFAHILYAVKSQSNDENNFKKAYTHIYRATVDNLKVVIKKNNLSNEATNKLIDARILEFNSMGKSINTDEKNELIKEYIKVISLI